MRKYRYTHERIHVKAIDCICLTRYCVFPQATTLDDKPVPLVRNEEFKTASTSNLEMVVSEQMWKRLVAFAELERPAICDRADCCDKVSFTYKCFTDCYVQLAEPT